MLNILEFYFHFVNTIFYYNEVWQNCITQLFIPPTGYYVEAHVGISGLLICMKTVPKLIVGVRVIVGLRQLIYSFIHTALLAQ